MPPKPVSGCIAVQGAYKVVLGSALRRFGQRLRWPASADHLLKKHLIQDAAHLGEGARLRVVGPHDQIEISCNGRLCVRPTEIAPVASSVNALTSVSAFTTAARIAVACS